MLSYSQLSELINKTWGENVINDVRLLEYHTIIMMENNTLKKKKNPKIKTPTHNFKGNLLS